VFGTGQVIWYLTDYAAGQRIFNSRHRIDTVLRVGPCVISGGLGGPFIGPKPYPPPLEDDIYFTFTRYTNIYFSHFLSLFLPLLHLFYP
jgi:hypothetical protein